MVETQVGHDPVNPRIERTLEAETTEVAIGLQESVLINILRILLRICEVQRETEDGVVVLPDEIFEGRAVTALRFAYQVRVIHAGLALPDHKSPEGDIVGTAPTHPSALPTAVRNRHHIGWHDCLHLSPA